jgi:hypothetical protein
MPHPFEPGALALGHDVVGAGDDFPKHVGRVVDVEGTSQRRELAANCVARTVTKYS